MTKSPAQLDREIASALVSGTAPSSKKRSPKTRIIYVVQGSYGHGWEDVTAETFRLIRRRERIA